MLSFKEDSSKSSSSMSMDIASESDDPRPVIDDLATYNRVFKPKRAIARSPARVPALSVGGRGGGGGSLQQQQQRASKLQPPQKLLPSSGEADDGEEEEEEDDNCRPFCPPPANVLPDLEKTMVPNDGDKVISDFLPPSSVQTSGRSSGINDPFAGMWSLMGGNNDDKATVKVPAPPARGNNTALSKEPSTVSRGIGSGEATTLQRLRTPHGALLSVLAARQKSLTTVRMLWPRENLKACVESAILMQDQAVFVDILRVVMSYSKQWSLDLVALLLPQLSKLIWSKYPAYVETACQAVRIILKNFANIIRQTIKSEPTIGVDISQEERQAKCQTCATHLEAIRSAFETKEVAAKTGQYGPEVFALFSLLQ
ncbi:hypothetical protein Aperf_G00000016508 [Anoplocephala perfoliata]